MRHLRKVKIVATLGPASSTYDVIKDLHQAGADVFRLNMSHGSHAEIRERHRIIREIEKELASPTLFFERSFFKAKMKRNTNRLPFTRTIFIHSRQQRIIIDFQSCRAVKDSINSNNNPGIFFYQR